MTLNAEYYTLNSDYSGLADVDFDGVPTDTSTVDALDIKRMRGAFWEGGAKNYFAARYHGDLNITEGGTYTFFLKSDSNAMLYLNGEPVIENAGGRGGRKGQITLDLDAGAHEIEIRYFDGRGRSTLQLEWEGPDSGGVRETIGGDAFSKGDAPDDDQTDGGDTDGSDTDDTGSGDDTGSDTDGGDTDDTGSGDDTGGDTDGGDTDDTGSGDDTGSDTDGGDTDDTGSGDDTGGDTDGGDTDDTGSGDDTGGDTDGGDTDDTGSGDDTGGDTDGGDTDDTGSGDDTGGDTDGGDTDDTGSGDDTGGDTDGGDTDDTGSGDDTGGDTDGGDTDDTGSGDDTGDDTNPTRQGLKGDYFILPGMVASLSAIDFDATPYGTGSVDSLNFVNGFDPFWDGGPGDLFAVRYTGNLNVEEAGTYTLYLSSDDGSMLYIDGEPVIDNDGLHGTEEQRVTLELMAGAHEIELRYYEAYGAATLKLEWAGPDSNGFRKVIDGDALSYGGTIDTGGDDGHTDGGDDGHTDGGDDGHTDGGDDGHTDGGDDGHTDGGDDGHTDGGDDGHTDGGDDGHTDGGDDGHTDGGDDGHTDGGDDGHTDGGDDGHTDGGDDGHTGGGDDGHTDGGDDGHTDGGDDGHTDGGDDGHTDGGDDGHTDGGDDGHTDGGDDGHTGGGDDGHTDHGSGHDNHSDGHVPPPTSPDEVEAYVAAVMAQPESHAHGDDASKMQEHTQVLDLVPRAEATHVAISDGDWFDPATWYEGRIPGEGAQVLIPEGISVNYAGESDASLFTLRVDGELSFAHDTDSKILIDTMVVSPTGRLEIGTEENPIGENVDVEIVIANNGDIDTGWDPMLLSRGVISHGSVEIHGAEKTSFLTVAEAPMAGDSEIVLSEIPEGWQVGDTIVLTGTHKQGWYWDEAAQRMMHHESEDEEVVITAINGNTITLDRALEHNHDAPREDLAAYVANTSRNVTFRSEDGEDTATHHRGHTMFMHSDDVDVRYAAFDDLGRTDKSQPAFDVTTLDNVQSDSNIKTRYPFHFHRTGTEDQEDPAIAIGNSVSGSPGWGYAHHDSHAIFTDNVAFDIFGAAFVAEDGNETGVWSHNIAIRTVGVGYGDSAVKEQSDVARHDNGRTGEAFFFAGRLVEAADNVAANTTHGFVWMTRSHPRDPLSENLDQSEIAYGSEYIRLDQPPIQGFHNNEAFGTEVGLIVIKNGPDQSHDVRSVMDGFLNWETNRGVDLSYTSHYTLIDFDLLASDGRNQYSDNGINLGGNAFDIVANGLTIEGFNTGANLDQPFHFGDNGADYGIVLIDVVMNDVGTDYVGYNAARHTIMSSEDLVSGRLGFVLGSEAAISEGQDFSLAGLKTDSIGTVERAFAGDPQTLWWHEDIAQFIANEGYYKTESGQNVLVLEDFVADRATGELYKMSHIITLNMSDAQIANSWSINYWGGAQYNGVISLDGVGPDTQDDSASTAAGEGVLIDVLSNDSHANGDDLRVDGLSTTPNASVYVQEDGQLLYIPNPDFVGVDSFHYWAADEDGEFTQATVTVEVFDL